MYDILWNLHYFCGLNHTKSILTDLFPNYTEEKQSIRKFFRSYVYPAMFNMVVMALYNIVDHPDRSRSCCPHFHFDFFRQPFPGLLYPGKCHCIEYPVIYDSDRLLPVSSGLYPGYLRRKRANYPLCP